MEQQPQTTIVPPAQLVVPEQDVVLLAKNMFKNTAEYLDGELQVVSADYKLLEKMNLLAADRYKGLADNTATLVTHLNDVQRRYQEFLPFLEQINQVERSVSELEKTVGMLDDYTKRMEAKFRKLDTAVLLAKPK